MAAPIRRTTRRTPRSPAARAVAGGSRDPDGGFGSAHELLVAAVDEAARLLGADGAMVYLVDQATGRLRFAHDAGIRSRRARAWVRSIELEPGTGMFGRAVEERSVVVTSDYPSDPSFRHAEGPDRVVADIGIRSFVVAPLSVDGDVFGALGTFSTRPDAFDEAGVALVRSLADHAAVAMANSRLIEALDHSRTELEERAEVERSLREINARISAASDLADVLQRAVDEAARLLRADGARIDLIERASGLLRRAYASGAVRPDEPDRPVEPDTALEQGVSGQAVLTGRPFWTDDYVHDRRFPRGAEADAWAEGAGVRSVMAAPLSGEAGPFGALTIFTGRKGAWSDRDAAVLEAIADQAAIAITNARLISELERSREENARRADTERTLREIATRITVLREPGDVLQRVVDEALRLLRADGALIDQYDPDSGTLQWAYDAGVPEAQRDLVKLTSLRLGEGVSGTAVAEGRVIRIGDYLTGEFQHDELADSLAVGAGIRDLIAAPIVGDAGPLGAIEVFSRRPNAFDDYDAAILGGLAEQAAIAITNARLIDELEHSQAALARRAETERSLRDITARIAALRDPDEVLTRVVEDARRLLGTDGAHLTRMDPSGAHLVPVVVEGSGDEDRRDWLMTMEFPLGGGINGLAVQEGGPIWTFDYLADPRIPHEPDDIAVADRLGLRGMAAAPLRAPGGEVLGTLAVSTDMPRLFEPAELDLLQGLADQAAIALTNSNLLARVTREEARFRGLVQTTPDVIWRADAEGYFTFVADSGEALFGWPIDEIIGRHFSFLVDPGSMAEAVDHYAAVGRDPDLVERNALVLKRRDGTRFAAEVTTTGVFEEGRWVGAQGTVRDVSERQRLQRELERSEERYRFLVENSPDVVFATDADGNFTFLSAAIERMTGFTAEELTGSHFSSVVDESTQPIAAERWAELAADPTREAQAALLLKGRDGRRTPVDVRSIGIGAGGAFAGIQGATRDISEQVRLQSELRRQAGELAASEERARLARELHDSVTQALFSMTLVSRSVEMLLDVDPAAARDRLGQLRDLQREALAEMRALIFELRPANLEETGLVPALEAHGAALQDRVGLPIAVDSDLAERLPLAIEEMLYRIAQEALHNVIKHAAASMARVELRRSVDGVHLIVSDDGKGFDPSAVSDDHLGLAGMRARAERTGARFRCDSDSGRGTTIEVVVPAAGLIGAGPESIATHGAEPPDRASRSTAPLLDSGTLPLVDRDSRRDAPRQEPT